MKKLILFSALALFFTKGFSLPDEPGTAVTKIEKVTVFLSGAQITRSGLYYVNEGTGKIRFYKLSPYIDPNSIQVKAKDDITILSVTHQYNYLSEQKKSPEVKALEDSLGQVNMKLDINRSLKNVYEEEKSLLVANKIIKVNEKTIFVEELEDVADFYRNRMSEIALKILEINKIEKKLNERRIKLQSQLNVANSSRSKSTGEIVIEVSSEKKVNTKFWLSYVVRNAGWTPTYDIRAESIEKPISLDYKAKVWQNTGIDWEKVELSLSTGNPSVSGNKPKLRPWTLQFQSPVINTIQISGYKKNAEKSQRAYGLVAPESNAAFDFEAIEATTEAPTSTTTASYTQMTQNQMSLEFNIKIPYTIPSDNKKHNVHIAQHELQASYQYYCAPKYDTDVFLLARVHGWSEYNILSGEASIYYEGTYIGRSYINTQVTKDTLDLSLGRDKSIVVERNRIKDFTEKKVIGSSKKETLGLQITLKNKKNTAVEIDLEDQIPVSSNKDIEVELLESSGAKHKETNGYLNWKVKLEPGASDKRIFKYSVKYPKNKIINL
ncbi:DUF4139 domain-containing protein [Bacteroidales bacterium AH-315-I05]|nr:DUF4139 domain-containing protein [Bacteroidales bacterium AH-315-I05]